MIVRRTPRAEVNDVYGLKNSLGVIMVPARLPGRACCFLCGIYFGFAIAAGLLALGYRFVYQSGFLHLWLCFPTETPIGTITAWEDRSEL